MVYFFNCFEKVCNPTAPAVPIQIYPLNGEYIPDKQFNLTFFAPGSFGTMCKPEIEAPFYTVSFLFFSFLFFSFVLFCFVLPCAFLFRFVYFVF